jgi:hypothetical protein
MFASPDETTRAMPLTARYLPTMLKLFEIGLEATGFRIVARSHYVDGAGVSIPVVEAEGRRGRMCLELRNAFDDFITIDREAEPVRLDTRLEDPDYAREKMLGIVRDRLALVVAIDHDELGDAELDAVARRFEWVRITRIDRDEMR